MKNGERTMKNINCWYTANEMKLGSDVNKNAGHSSFLKLLLFCLLGALATKPSHAKEVLPSSQRLDDRALEIQTLYDAQDKPMLPGGFGAVVVESGTVLFNKTYGYANNEHEIPLTTSSVFDFASVAKQFTGLAIAMLIEQGKIDLNDDIRKYVPELPYYGSVITIEHILHHTSGIRDWVALVKLSGRYMGDTITNEFLMRLISSQEELNFPPGEKFSYSNSGYFLLSEVVSRATKTSFRNWTEENIFKPLEMNNTHFSDDHTEIVEGRADSYLRNDDGEYINSSNLLTSPGSSSLFSTLDDMTKWVQNFHEKKIGGKAAWEMMVRKGSLNNGESVDYGFGLNIGDYDGMVRYRHGGSWAGYLCDVLYFPEEHLSTILIINRDPSQVYVEGELNAILFNDEKTVQKPAPEKKDVRRDKVEIRSETLEEYVGLFHSRKDKRTVETEKNDDRLVFHFPWRRNVEAVPLSEKAFYVERYDWEFSFARDDTGFVNQILFHSYNENPGYDSEDSSYDRVYPDISALKDVDDLTGEYYSEELQTTYRIVKRDNSLLAEHMHNEDVQFMRLNENLYIGDKWWFEEMEVIRNADGLVAGFRVNADNDLVQNVLFEKK
jgi:CubicO group peptidase (beta-lactamase class C family)